MATGSTARHSAFYDLGMYLREMANIFAGSAQSFTWALPQILLKCEIFRALRVESSAELKNKKKNPLNLTVTYQFGDPASFQGTA